MSWDEADTSDEQSKIISRFWAKVEKTPTCWLWTASKRHKGYGAFAYVHNGQMIQDRAHRFSYRLHYGAFADALCVLHRCDTPACVNPQHLFLGTKADNNHDMIRKGRRVVGGTHCREQGRYSRGGDWYAAHGKHSPQNGKWIYDRAAIKADRQFGLSYPKLAKKYGCSLSHAQRICKEEG